MIHSSSKKILLIYISITIKIYKSYFSNCVLLNSSDFIICQKKKNLPKSAINGSNSVHPASLGYSLLSVSKI